MMSRTATYRTTVNWKGEHWGHIVMGNGPEMDFSAPPDAQGHSGVFTPEDAFVAAANTCVMMMFIWAAERFKLKLISYECRTEGTKLIELDRTEIFTHLRFWPQIKVSAGAEDHSVIEARTHRALQAAQKYSLVANSVKSQIVIEPTISIVD
jgi:organic hydroperoxide reductase OsmC/OhrA